MQNAEFRRLMEFFIGFAEKLMGFAQKLDKKFSP